MNERKLIASLSLIGLLNLFLLISCGKEEGTEPKPTPTPPNTGAEKDEVNVWIDGVMRINYLWNDEIPSEGQIDYNDDPEEFFYSILSDKDGKVRNGSRQYFSYIERANNASTRTIHDGVPTYGFEFILYTFPSSEELMTQVVYVLPGSPAEEAGLKRGDWIYSVNGDELTRSNYTILESGGQAEFVIYNLNSTNSALVFDRVITVSPARLVENTPFLKDEVFDISGRKIAYLMYNRFRSGPTGTSDVTYNTQMQEIFYRFKQQGVNDFVLDMRYNGGGLVSCAQLLTSMLAPESALGNTFCKMVYNGSKRDDSYSFLTDNTIKARNLNLSRLYVLVGQNTASASELVINALIPYMGRENITIIGTQTVGKTVGSETFGSIEENGWAMHPITFYIYNSNDEADYEDGFVPDINLNEFGTMNQMYELGDPRELLLNRAITQITGTRSAQIEEPAASSVSKLIYSSLDRYNRGSGLEK